MSAYNVKLLGAKTVADGTMAFSIEKPAGFTFKSGQSPDVTLLSPPQTDAEGDTRTFSIVTAPFEDHLMVATRMRDTAFKRVLKTLPVGSLINIDGPHGSMTLHNDTSKVAVILAGGIGITPFHSMVKDAAHQHLPHQIYLFFSNKLPKDAPFLDELQALTAENPNYHFVPTMTDVPDNDTSWSGKRGRITKELIAEFVPDFSKVVFYTAGPEGMVTAMRGLLNEAGVNDDYIRSEEFIGY